MERNRIRRATISTWRTMSITIILPLLAALNCSAFEQLAFDRFHAQWLNSVRQMTAGIERMKSSGCNIEYVIWGLDVSLGSNVCPIESLSDDAQANVRQGFAQVAIACRSLNALALVAQRAADSGSSEREAYAHYKPGGGSYLLGPGGCDSLLVAYQQKDPAGYAAGQQMAARAARDGSTPPDATVDQNARRTGAGQGTPAGSGSGAGDGDGDGGGDGGGDPDPG